LDISQTVAHCVQSEESGGGNSHERLDQSAAEPTARVVTSPVDHYSGLGVQPPGSGLDRHGYIQVVADPEYVEVCGLWKAFLMCADDVGILQEKNSGVFLAGRTATQYDRLLASSCCPSVCLSVTLCTVALRVGVQG